MLNEKNMNACVFCASGRQPWWDYNDYNGICVKANVFWAETVVGGY